jgi:hypothetical protein
MMDLSALAGEYGEVLKQIEVIDGISYKPAGRTLTALPVLDLLISFSVKCPTPKSR